MALLAIVALGYLADRAYQAVTGLRADLKAIEAQDAKSQAIIASKDAENNGLKDTIAALASKDALLVAERAQLREALAAKTTENEKLREDLKTAPPEAILATTKNLLASGEVWLRNNAASQVEAVFSLSAFRLNADALVEREYLKFTLVPALESDIKAAEEELTLRAAMIVNYETIVTNKDSIIVEKDIQLGLRDDLMRTIKKRNLWRTLAYVGGGLAVGYIISR